MALPPGRLALTVIAALAMALIVGALDRSLQEKLSPHCPEIQGCIRCGVCVETPNPSYKLPDKWKALGTSPRYLRVAAP